MQGRCNLKLGFNNPGVASHSTGLMICRALHVWHGRLCFAVQRSPQVTRMLLPHQRRLSEGQGLGLVAHYQESDPKTPSSKHECCCCRSIRAGHSLPADHNCWVRCSHHLGWSRHLPAAPFRPTSSISSPGPAAHLPPPPAASRAEPLS